MPRPGKRWRHIIINTHGSWLHGDHRGFRSRGHRIHSSGDCKRPPPRGEHANLFKYMKQKCPNKRKIPRELRPIIGRTIVQFFLDSRIPILAYSGDEIHAHFLVEVGDNLAILRKMVGDAKRKSSRAVKDQLPGTVWSAGEEPTPVDDPEHQKNSYEYILYKQGPDAWTWSFRDGSLEGMFDRKRKKIQRKKNPGRR